MNFIHEMIGTKSFDANKSVTYYRESDGDDHHYFYQLLLIMCIVYRRAVHVSVYDKNFDDQVRPTVVPDDVIQPGSDKYWSPHPQTGVFGPAAEHSQVAGGERSFYSSAAANGGEDSVLEQKAFFRPLEDLEKPIEL